MAISDLTASPSVATIEARATYDFDAENLVNLKNLLDNEVISQEEFDAKKKQLLGL